MSDLFIQRIDLLALIVVLLIVLIRWIMILNEEAKAPPIIINSVSTKESLRDQLIKSSNSSSSNNTINETVSKSNFKPQKTSRVGNSGYANSTLGQPCFTEDSDYVKPNIPVDYVIPKCNTDNGEECVTGIYEGGGICLKIVNQSCTDGSECSPEASFCINNICQQEGEVINKPCVSDLDCKGVLKNLNHVCDTVSKRCVFDIWPNDSGCTNVNQCNYNKGNPGQVSCVTSGEGTNYLVKFTGTYDSTTNSMSLVSSPNNSIFKDNGFKGYLTIYTQQNSYFGRFLIKSSSESEVTFFLKPNGIVNGDTYILELGTERDGICVINYPLGSKPPLIEGTSTRYPCDTGLELSKNNFCVEKGRVEGSGKENQVCIYDSVLTCESGLECTFDPSLLKFYKSGLDSKYVSNGEINGQLIKNIGSCKNQDVGKYLRCSDNCEKDLICLRESDLNNKTFTYCGYDWQLLRDQSNLTGCTSGFSLDSTSETCKYNLDNFCFNDNECVNGYKCNNNTQHYVTYIDPITGSRNKDIVGTTISTQNQIYLISSKEVDSNNKPEFLGYYYKISSTQWGVNYSLNGGNYLDSDMTVTFEDTLAKDPTFSVFKKNNNNYQLNIEYILEYENNRKRTFSTESGNNNFFYSCLKNGTSVYFENQTGIYSLNFSPGYVNIPSFGNLEILKLDDPSTGTSVPISDFNNQDMITFDSRFVANVESNFFQYDSLNNNLNNGEKFTYKSRNLESHIFYLLPGSPNSQELDPDINYYSYIFNSDISDNFTTSYLFFSRDFQGTNFNPYLLDATGTPSYYENISLNTNVEGGLTYNFTSDNTYVQLQTLYGFNFVPLEISDSSYSGKTITIKSRNDYFSSDSVSSSSFNYPVGKLVDTININTEISENSLFVTYNFSNNINETVKMNYTTGTPYPSGESSQDFFNYIETNVDGSDTSYYINFTTENVFEPPNLKVPSGTSYSVNQSPYDLDNIRIFQESDTTNTVNFFSTYKNIVPSNSKTAISTISTLRLMTPLLDLTQDTDIFSFYYQGLNDITETNFNPINGNVPFGGSFYVNLSSIIESITSNNTEDNIFLGGTNTIIFKNQNDIDVLLKYGVNDLVIGFNDYKSALCIVAIDEYDVDLKGNQQLIVKTSYEINSYETITNPILYVNNIYPINYSTDQNVTDGRILFSSTVPKKYLSENNIDYFFEETSYNKILSGPINGANRTIYDFYFFYNNPIITAGGDLNFLRSTDVSGTVNNFLSGNYNLQIFSGTTSNNPPSINGYVFILNNKFLSTTLTYSPNVYVNDRKKNSTNSVVSLYTDTDQNQQIKTKGSVFTSLNTFPFYTSLNGYQGLLDESYLSEIFWPYWIKNLNTGSLNIKNIIVNWNPGNMENDMYYYCFVEVGGWSSLLYLSTNFTESDVIQSQTVPFILDQGENTEDITKSLSMNPIDKNLILISPVCRNI